MKIKLGSLEFSSNSTWLLVRGSLFCIQHLPCLVNFGCMLGGCVKILTKIIVYQSLVVKLTVACQEVLKWVWPSINLNKLLYIQSQTLPPNMHHKCKINQLKNIGNKFLTKCPIELKNDFNVLYAIQDIVFTFLHRIWYESWVASPMKLTRISIHITFVLHFFIVKTLLLCWCNRSCKMAPKMK